MIRIKNKEVSESLLSGEVVTNSLYVEDTAHACENPFLRRILGLELSCEYIGRASCFGLVNRTLIYTLLFFTSLLLGSATFSTSVSPVRAAIAFLNSSDMLPSCGSQGVPFILSSRSLFQRSSSRLHWQEDPSSVPWHA